MLSVEEMRRIARDVCVEMLGKDLVYAHKDLCCACFGILDDGMFHYNLGMDTKEKPYKFGSEGLMDYYAFVIVDPSNGAVVKDYQNSTLPN